MFDIQLPKSFSIELKDLHCVLYFVFIKGDQHSKQLKQCISDLKKCGYILNEEKQNAIDIILKDCQNNPGFTIDLDDTNVVCFFRIDQFLSESCQYFIGILAHEINHAITFVFQNLGISNDDELRSIEIGNTIEESLLKLTKCIYKNLIKEKIK